MPVVKVLLPGPMAPPAETYSYRRHSSDRESPGGLTDGADCSLTPGLSEPDWKLEDILRQLIEAFIMIDVPPAQRDGLHSVGVPMGRHSRRPAQWL